MIIRTIKGDLIALAKEGRYYGIAHGANCQNTMRAGIAPKICNAWPEAREADLTTVKGDIQKLGTYSDYFCEESDLWVFNLYTQWHWSRSTSGNCNLNYKALSDCFHWLDLEHKWNQSLSGKPVGIPMIGSGLAGGHWEAIREIINLNTPDLEIEVVVFEQ